MFWKVFAVVPLLLFASLSARADGPDLTFSNPGTVITAPTDVAVNLVMPGDADRQAVAALLVIEYDPAVVTLSNPRAANPTLWNDFSVYSVPDAHQLRVLMLTNGYASGQTTSGPLMYVTVTPVGSSADLSVCPTLRLVGGAYGQELTCNLAIYRPSLNDYDSVWAASSCGPLGPIYVPPIEDGITIGDETGDVDNTDGATSDGLDDVILESLDVSSPCQPDIIAATRILKITGGLIRAIPSDLSGLDFTGDGKIRIEDAIAVLRAPCFGPTRAWNLPLPNGISSNMPALADIDRDGRLDAAVTQEWQQGYHVSPPRNANNPNKVMVISDLTGTGGYGVKEGQTGTPAYPGWAPHPEDGWYGAQLPDACNGVTFANILGNLGSNEDPLEVLASNFQSNYPEGTGIFSHLYVWNWNATEASPFAHTNNPRTLVGRGSGHSVTAPVVYDFDRDNVPNIFFVAQGQLNPNVGGFLGSLHILDPTAPTDPTKSFVTQSDPGQPWYRDPYDNNALFDTPPVFPRVTDDEQTNIVLASESGLLYQWTPNGLPVSNWYPSATARTETDFFRGIDNLPEPAPFTTSFAAADLLDNDGIDEVVTGSGYVTHYWGGAVEQPDGTYKFYPRFTLDGAVYCWDRAGNQRWRYPVFKPSLQIQDFEPAVSSGISVGRLIPGSQQKYVVYGNAEGEVVALDPAADDQYRVLWRFTAQPKSYHIAYRPIRTQPLIADINGDGRQEVVVGNSNGYIYALAGVTGRELWRSVTFPAVDSTWLGVTESHYEEVRGLAIGPMRGGDPTRATIVVTTGIAQVAGDPKRGHIMILDCGPNTFDSLLADWPQLQKNERRTGTDLPW